MAHNYTFLSVRIGIGAALSQLGWWGGTVLMGQVGPILLSSSLRTPGTFYLFAGTFVLVFLHVLLLLPETKVTVTYWPTLEY